MKRIFTGFLVITSLVACSRAAKNQNSSSLIIKTPSQQQLSKGSVSALAAMPTDRKICFGVSIRGPGIEGFANSCSPTTGVVAGFVEAGQPIEAFVPKGYERTVELYAFLLPVGSTASCPLMTANLSGDLLKSLYLIGKANNVSLVSETEVVQITMDFPGVANTVAQQLNAPATCNLTPLTPKTGSSVASGGGTATGTGIILHSSFGKATGGTVATGSGIKLIGRAK